MARKTKAFYFSFVIALIIFTLLMFFAMPASILTTAVNIAVYTIFFSALLFIILFSLWSNWWEHQMAWTLVILDLGLVLATAPAVIHLLLGIKIIQSAFFARYTIVSLTLAATGVIWRTWIMVKHNFVDKLKKERDVRKNRQSETGSVTEVTEA